MDSPPNSDPGLQGLAAAAVALQQRPQHLARSLSESRKVEEHDHPPAKCRPNKHTVPYHFVLQDHNYGAPPPPTPPLSPVPPVQNSRPMVHHHHHHHHHHHMQSAPPLTAQDLCGMAALATVADQVRAGSTSLSLLLQAEEDSRGSPLSSDEHDDPGPEGEETETAAEGEGDEDSVTRCICDFEHDDGYMICCDKCFVWQHVDCMGIDRSNIPDEYLCELCQPRRVDRMRARNLQLRKQMHNDTSSSDDDQQTAQRHSTTAAASQARRLSAASAARKRQVKRETKKVVKRQRRDSAAVAAREQRVSERRANKKREIWAAAAGGNSAGSPTKTETKRIGTRRRSKGKPDSLDEETQDGWGGSNHSSSGHQSPGAATPGNQNSVCAAPQQPQQLRQWIDNYEEAVTNHYSPELRARISSIKVNGVHSDFKVASSSVQKCRTTMQENGLKVLISTSQLHANQPIIEIRGKYMLAAQHQQSRGGGGGRGGAAAAASSPYLLFYTLPKEGTEVCIDARTYGNDARFVRSSCKPNAEVRHCIEKGALHLYLVASTTVERHAEITIKHEETGPRSHCKDCPPSGTPISSTLRNGLLSQDSSDRRGERRRRGSRRNTVSDDSVSLPTANSVPVEPVPSPPAVVPVASPPVTTPPASVTPAVTPTTPPAQQQQQQPAPVINSSPVTRRGPKSPIKVTPTTPVTPAPPTPASEDSNDGMSMQDDTPMSNDKRKMTREERKMEAIMKAFERLEKAEQRRQETLARQQQQRQRGGSDSHDGSRDEDDHHEIELVRRPKGRRTRGRSSSGASSQAMSADESSIGGQHQLSPTPHSNTTSPHVLSPPLAQPAIDKTATVMLNNCLAFKFPKTKKVLMNEWLSKPANETPVSPVKLDATEEIIGRTGAAAAKKRWLRQAISEESEPTAGQQCSSPRAGSPPGGDYVTPLKKRRLARESLSSEQSFTPPTTPASDKEEARSPELEELPGTSVAEPLPPQLKDEHNPAAQIHNAARCVEEAVKVLSAGTDFMEQLLGDKTADIKPLQETPIISPVKVESSPVKVEVKDDSLDEKLTAMEALVAIKEEKPEVERLPLPSNQTPTSPSYSPPVTPATPTGPSEAKESPSVASIKRKLSISEYRQRKQKAEGDKGGDGCDGLGTPSPTSQDDERERSTTGSPSDMQLDSTDGKTDAGWNSEPTLVERQRENLTERLKREFGLFLDDQDPNRAAAAAAAVAAATASGTIAGITPASKKQAGTVTGVMTPNNCPLLPPLPPLEPPSVKSSEPHNIPLPPCSPPPLHDLLSEPPPPPLPPPAAEDGKPAEHSKSAKLQSASNAIGASTMSPVQNGPSNADSKLLSQSKIFGGVQIKNQILSSTSSSTIPQLNNCTSTTSIPIKSSCKTINKKPIPTCTPPSLQNTAIRSSAANPSTAATSTI